MNDGNADYIPYNKALVLEGEEDDSEELKKEIQELKESLLEMKVMTSCFVQLFQCLCS